MNSHESPPNRPGAPRGNTNALKHGFYSPRFRDNELEDLKALIEPGLTDEIAMLRIIIRRTVDRVDEIENLDQQLRFISTLSHASAQLSRLLRTQRLLVGEVSQIEQALQQAIYQLEHED